MNIERPVCECNYWCLPNFVLYDQNLNLMEAFKLSKKKYKFTLVIGTSVQFEYIRYMILNTKKLGSKVIHINPNPEYKIGKNEILIKENSNVGLEIFIKNILNK